MSKRVFWITGLSGAGKTTIGMALYYRLKSLSSNVVILDGDMLKDAIDGKNAGYTNEDRHSRAVRYSRLCKLLADQDILVICCTIAMFSDVRQWNRDNISDYVEVFLDVPRDVLISRDSKNLYARFEDGTERNLVGFDMDVDLPKNPDITIKNDGSRTVAQCVNEILAYSISNVSARHRDEEYWNNYYSQRLADETPSPFARYVMDMVEKGESLVDLGCGNGRDSLYFYRNGIAVTAMDKSSVAISQIKMAEPRLHCLCGDVTKVNELAKRLYDNAYSRFCLHALTADQQHESLKAAHDVLNMHGKIWIEVRGIYDTIYGLGEKIGEHEFVYGGHARRFLVMSELTTELELLGFKVHYAKESSGFAPHGDDDPVIIRIMAEKVK